MGSSKFAHLSHTALLRTWVSLQLRPWLNVFSAMLTILLGCAPRKGVRFLQIVRANDEVWQSDRQKNCWDVQVLLLDTGSITPHFTSGGLAHRLEAAFKWFKSFRHFGLLYASGRLLHHSNSLRLAKWQNMAIPSQKVPGPMSDGFRLRWQHTENSKVLILYHLILPDTWCTTMHPDAKLQNKEACRYYLILLYVTRSKVMQLAQKEWMPIM